MPTRSSRFESDEKSGRDMCVPESSETDQMVKLPGWIHKRQICRSLGAFGFHAQPAFRNLHYQRRRRTCHDLDGLLSLEGECAIDDVQVVGAGGQPEASSPT